MTKHIRSYDDVSLCYEDKCIHASGDNGRLIAMGAFAMLLLIGIAALTKNN